MVLKTAIRYEQWSRNHKGKAARESKTEADRLEWEAQLIWQTLQHFRQELKAATPGSPEAVRKKWMVSSWEANLARQRHAQKEQCRQHCTTDIAPTSSFRLTISRHPQHSESVQAAALLRHQARQGPGRGRCAGRLRHRHGKRSRRRLYNQEQSDVPGQFPNHSGPVEWHRLSRQAELEAREHAAG